MALQHYRKLMPAIRVLLEVRQYHKITTLEDPGHQFPIAGTETLGRRRRGRRPSRPGTRRARESRPRPAVPGACFLHAGGPLRAQLNAITPSTVVEKFSSQSVLHAPSTGFRCGDTERSAKHDRARQGSWPWACTILSIRLKRVPRRSRRDRFCRERASWLDLYLVASAYQFVPRCHGGDERSAAKRQRTSEWSGHLGYSV